MIEIIFLTWLLIFSSSSGTQNYLEIDEVEVTHQGSVVNDTFQDLEIQVVKTEGDSVELNQKWTGKLPSRLVIVVITFTIY